MSNTPVLDSIVEEIHRRAAKEGGDEGHDFTVTITGDEYLFLCEEEQRNEVEEDPSDYPAGWAEYPAYLIDRDAEKEHT